MENRTEKNSTCKESQDNITLIQTAANAVCGSIEDKKSFSTYASELNRLMKYTDRDDIASPTRKEYEAIAATYSELQKKRRHVDTTDLMVEINSIISEYVEIDNVPLTVKEESRRFAISAIDFDLLRREFAKLKKKNLVMKDLEEIIQQKLDRLLFNNPDRINYYERYQQIITDYNSEQDRATIEKTFMDLMDLANSLDKEEVSEASINGGTVKISTNQVQEIYDTGRIMQRIHTVTCQWTNRTK